MEKNEIKLKYPITVNGTAGVSILTMSRLKTKHLKLFPEDFLKAIGGAESERQEITLAIIPKLIPLIASLLGMTEEDADEKDVTDLMAISERMGRLLGN